MLKRLLVVCILVIAAALALLIGNSISAAQDPLDKFTYLPIIFKGDGPTSPWHSLAIHQSAWPNPVQAGGLLTYTLRYTVTGNEPATGLTLVDTIPPTTTYQSCTGSVTCYNQAGRVTWPLGQVLPATGGVVTMVLRVGEAVISGTKLYNTAALTDTSNRLVTHTLPVVVQTTHSLSLTQTAWPNPVHATELLTYTIYYTVTGTESAPGLTLVDTLPASTTFQTCEGGVSCNQADGRVMWFLGDVSPATGGVVTMVVQVDTWWALYGPSLQNVVTLTDTFGLSVTSLIKLPGPLDVAIVFDTSGSMQMDTNCYGCYEPYGDGAVSWKTLDLPYDYPHPAYINRIPIGHLPTTYQDGTANVTGTNNLGQLCWGRDSGNQPAYYTIVGTPTKYYVVIEGELYSLNSSVLAGPLRQPGRGYWAVQNADYRVIFRMEGNNGDPDNTFATGATPIGDTGGYRSSWVSHMPYVSWAVADVIPYGYDYTLTEARSTPNDVPSLEYDFITKSDWGVTANPDDTRIWVRVQANGDWADTKNLYWAVYRYSDLYAAGVDGDPTKTTPLGTGQIEQLPTLPKGGSGYGGADGDYWAWRQLNSSGLDLDNGQRYTLKLWAGGPGVGIDQIVIGNQNDTGFTPNANGGITTLKATAGSAFRQACNHCNPIYGLTISSTAECLPPKDNGANTVPMDNYDLANPQNNPLYSGYQPLQGTKEAVKRFIGRLNPYFDQAGLVTYGSDTPIEGQVELRCLRHESADMCLGTNPITYTQMLTALERIPPYGATNMAKGMRKGLEVLGIDVDGLPGFDDTCVDDTDHCSRGGSARRVMIVMTDGVANINPGGTCATAAYANLYPPTNYTGYPDDIAKDCVIYYAQKARENGVTLYDIGLGNGVDVDLMQQVAVTAQGQFFMASSTDRLDAVFEAILQTNR